jgi:hypothetical protein
MYIAGSKFKDEVMADVCTCCNQMRVCLFFKSILAHILKICTQHAQMMIDIL